MTAFAGIVIILVLWVMMFWIYVCIHRTFDRRSQYLDAISDHVQETIDKYGTGEDLGAISLEFNERMKLYEALKQISNYEMLLRYITFQDPDKTIDPRIRTLLGKTNKRG